MLQSEALQILQRNIEGCTKCAELAEFRTANNYKTVPGIGNPNARLMVIGEAPGENEAKEGEPFIGKAGNLLTNILKAAGWERQDIYITNTIKCRPPGNRDPAPEEAANCRKYLELQIKTIKPEWIICFGRIASVYLLGREQDTTIGSLRGQIHDFEGIKVICTYHPSYLLRTPAAKQQVWEDIQPAIVALQSKSEAV